MKEILRVTEEWSADSEEEIEQIINDATSNGGELTKKTVELKQKKKKGMILAEKYKVTTQVTYTDIWDNVVLEDAE